MSLNHYNLYLEQVFQLAETIVIKSEGSAQSINDRLKYLYGDAIVDPTDKTTWKYYLNLAGKYHPTDKKIIITSLDTLQPIEFNADNLRIHTATAQAYQYGSRYYRELVSQYSTDYEQIILGALYPIDIQKAIDSGVDGIITNNVTEVKSKLKEEDNIFVETYKAFLKK